MGILQQLGQKVIDRDYYLTSHAEEEMWADGLERSDVDNVLLKGRVEKKLTRIRVVYVTESKAPRRTVGRFTWSVGSTKRTDYAS